MIEELSQIEGRESFQERCSDPKYEQEESSLEFFCKIYKKTEGFTKLYIYINPNIYNMY